MTEHIYVTDAVKAEPGSLRVRILGGPHGTDRQGQTFDTGTDFGRARIVPLLYYHGFREQNEPHVTWIGEATKAERDDAGQWYVGELDPELDISKQIYADATAGKARASSDSMPHLVRPKGILGKPGRVTSWPIGAISLMDASTHEFAVNPGAMVSAAKAVLDGDDADKPGDEAVKAGATIARRNRDRLLRIKSALDELLAEVPEETTTEQVATHENIVSVAGAKAQMETVDIAAIADAIKTQVADAVKAQLAEFDKRVTETARPKFEAPTVTGIADATKAYEDAWIKYVKTGDHRDLDNRLEAVKATMIQGTDANGGYLVPEKYAQELIRPTTEASIFRAAGARQITIDGTDKLHVPSITHSGTWALTAESTAYNQAEPTFGEVVFDPYKYTRISLVSEELLAMSRFDVFNEVLAPDAMQGLAATENSIFAVGTGSSQPQGIVAGSVVGATAAATNAFTLDEVIDLTHSVAVQYRANCHIFAHDTVLKYIRKFRALGTNGDYLWQPATVAGQPDRLLGYPVHAVSTMSSAFTTGQKLIVFGDPRYFWIGDFNGGAIVMKRLDELYAANGHVAFRWNRWMDSNVMLSAAIKHLALA